MNKVEEFKLEFMKGRCNSLYICAGGFEDRARAFVEKLKDAKKKFFKYSLILKYSTQKEDNKSNLEFLKNTLPKISHHIIGNINIIVDINNIYQTKKNLIEAFKKIPIEDIETVFIDISGMANSLILLSINQVKKMFPSKEVTILYAEADSYYPSKEKEDEILRLMESDEDKDILKLGEELGASGAREVIILPSFEGYLAENKPICLIFFVGYEPSRAAGLLENYRPNMTVVCYGVSPHEKFKWRAEFSKKLHTKLFEDFERVEQYISTFKIPEIVEKLDKIYKSIDKSERPLFEHYNIAITPQNSKLQTVATYLFSQMHPDIQIVFCYPGKYNPERYSKGIGKLWIYKLQNI